MAISNVDTGYGDITKKMWDRNKYGALD